MKILVVADVESKALWEFYEQNRHTSPDLILSCGDLDADYLSFLTTMYHCDVLYVHGNHDNDYEKNPPEGCICIDDDLINYNGTRILGLGGSMKYNLGRYQYSEKQMRRRYWRLWTKIQRYRGFDILLTHAPAKGLHDGKDMPHRGFQCFLDMIERYKPRYFVHGHVHMNYGYGMVRKDHYRQTIVVNAYEKYSIEYEKSLDKS